MSITTNKSALGIKLGSLVKDNIIGFTGVALGRTECAPKEIIVRRVREANLTTEGSSERKDAEYQLVDIADYNLPLLDEPVPPSHAQYSHEHTLVWLAKIASFAPYVFVIPEYNHSTSIALKNVIDYPYRE